MRPRRRAFSLHQTDLRNKLRQIKHVIRLWIPVCCTTLAPELSLDPVQQRQREKGGKKGESSIVLSGSRRWFVFYREQPAKSS